MIENTNDQFNINALKLKPEAIQSAPIETETIKRIKEKRNNRQQFVKVPWDWAMALKSARRAPTLKLAMLLLHELWRSPDQPVTVSNTRAAEFGHHQSRDRNWGTTRLLDGKSPLRL